MKNKKITRLTAVLVAVIIILAGALGYVATLSRAPVAKPGEIVEYTIGFALAVSGGYAVDGPVRRDGAILAVENMNNLLKDSGSRYRFKYVHEDSMGTAEGAIRAYESLYAAGVSVIVGPFSSGEAKAVKSFCDTNKIVTISPASTSLGLEVAGDYIYRMVPTDIAQGSALVDIIGKQGYEKAAIIAREDDYGKGIADYTEKLFKEKYGGTAKTLFFTIGLPDYATEVSTLSDMVRELGVGPTTCVIIVAFEEGGLNILDHARMDETLRSVKWFGSETLRRPKTYLPPPTGGASPDITDFMAEVELTGCFPSPAKNPVMTSFEEAYKARFGREPSPYTYYTYDSVWVAMLGVLAAGKAEGEAVAAVLPQVCKSYIGASGYKALNKYGDCAGADYPIWRVVKENGEYKYKEIGIWYFATEELSWY